MASVTRLAYPPDLMLADLMVREGLFNRAGQTLLCYASTALAGRPIAPPPTSAPNIGSMQFLRRFTVPGALTGIDRHHFYTGHVGPGNPVPLVRSNGIIYARIAGRYVPRDLALRAVQTQDASLLHPAAWPGWDALDLTEQDFFLRVTDLLHTYALIHKHFGLERADARRLIESLRQRDFPIHLAALDAFDLLVRDTRMAARKRRKRHAIWGRK